MGAYQFVYFDLETTGLGMDDQIIQIAARTPQTKFNVYITPTRHVHWKAREITGFELINDKLYLNGKRVRSIPAKYALQNFVNYLAKFSRDVILIAHNGFKFDMPRILALAKEHGFLDEFRMVVKGFSDSLIILKTVLVGRSREKGNFTLKALVKDYSQKYDYYERNFHNAEYDAQCLLELFCYSSLQIPKNLIIQISRTF